MPKRKVDREELILNALKVFRNKGYYHTSVADLAKACNIEKPHFYYYFKDKENLMLEVLKFSHEETRKHITSKAYNEEYTVRQRIRKMMENSRKLQAEDFGGCIMGNTIQETSGYEENFKEVLKAYIEDWKTALKYLLEKKYEEDEADRIATELVSELQGSLMMMKLYRDSFLYYKLTEKIEKIVC